MKYQMLEKIQVIFRLGRVRHMSTQMSLPKGRTVKGSPTQASPYPLYCVTIFIRQPINQAAS